MPSNSESFAARLGLRYGRAAVRWTELHAEAARIIETTEERSSEAALLRLRGDLLNVSGTQATLMMVPSDETSGLDDEIGAATVVRTDDLLHVLGVQPRRERGRTNEIGEHHRHLAALGVGPWGGRRISGRRGRLSHGYPASATALNSLSRAPSGRPSSRRCSSVRSQARRHRSHCRETSARTAPDRSRGANRRCPSSVPWLLSAAVFEKG